MVELVKTRIPQRFGLDPIRDIQVLCPMNRGGVGARSLNVELQKALNPAGERKVERFGWTFAPGDKVMQIENDYEKEVYNGDIGYIDDVDPDQGELTASFDGRAVTYGFGELDTLVPAYAATIHKSQGSEYPAVVIPVVQYLRDIGEEAEAVRFCTRLIDAEMSRAAADEFAFGLHIPLLELFAIVAEMLLEDVLGQDVERLEVGERIGDRGGVGDLERAVVDRLKARGVVDVARHQTGRDVGVLEDGVASPLRVFGCQWRAVRPLARLDFERVDLAVGRDGPRFGPVADELEVFVVLDERRVRLLEDDVGDLVRANEGIDAIRRVGVADAEDAAFLDGSGSVTRVAAVAGGGAWRGRCSTTAGGENAEQGNGE